MLGAEVAAGWQLPILSCQHISPAYSQLRENTSEKTPKLIPQVSEAGCCYLTASARSPAHSGDAKAASFDSAGLSLPRDSFMLRPTWLEPPPCQRCHRVQHHRLAPAQLRRWRWIRLCLWWAAPQLLPQPPLHSPPGCTPGAGGTGRACHWGSLSAQSKLGSATNTVAACPSQSQTRNHSTK